MSHLSILPTVLRDADCLAATLEALSLRPERGSRLHGFGDQAEPVDLLVRLEGGETLGWQRQPDGSLALVGDLQRISRAKHLQDLIGRITRSYAARRALQEASLALPEALIEFGV